MAMIWGLNWAAPQNGMPTSMVKSTSAFFSQVLPPYMCHETRHTENMRPLGVGQLVLPQKFNGDSHGHGGEPISLEVLQFNHVVGADLL
jgi:hypothetical protein